MKAFLKKLVPRRIYDFELREAVKGVNFSFEGMTFRAKVVSVYDGDTLTLVFRYGGKLQQHSCRMLGYDSPEMKPLRSMKGRNREISQAKIARKALIDQVEGNGWMVQIRCHKFDKYGRILIDLYVPSGGGGGCFCFRAQPVWVNEWMIEKGYGYPYDGGKKRAK